LIFRRDYENVPFVLEQHAKNGDRLVELMISVLVSYVEDGGVGPWVKPKIIICICCTKGFFNLKLTLFHKTLFVEYASNKNTFVGTKCLFCFE
jgi:hypothetical protein